MGPTGFKGFQYDNGLMWDDWESLQLLSLAESACSQISGATPLWRMVWSISTKKTCFPYYTGLSNLTR